MNHNQDKLSVGGSSGLSSEVSDETLNNSVANLADEITPERDLWLGIERAISQKSQHSVDIHTQSKFVSVAWAASFVAAIALSWLTFTPQIQQKAQQVAQQKNSADLVANPVATEQIVTFMQANFQQQKEAMLVSFGQPNLSQLSVAMQKELQQLAAARESIRQALLKDKNDIDLLNLLDFTQQQELKLISQLYQQYQVI